MLPVAQYPLAFAAGEPPSFDNFVPGPSREAAAMAQAAARGRGERYLYLAGPAGTGKTHLLIAAARASEGFYLSLAEPGIEPEAAESLETASLVCLDGIGAAAGRRGWELALFRLFNALQDSGARLVVADRAPPGQLGFTLPDLTSRLASGPVLRLDPLGESELERVLRARARTRGFELSPRAAAYLVNRERRDTRHLIALLDRLDRHSLAAHRELTIPFIRSLLEGRE